MALPEAWPTSSERRDPSGLDIREAELEAQSCPSVNVPKTQRTFCKMCCKQQPHKVTQCKEGKDSRYTQGKRRYDQKQSGYVWWAKTTKKTVLRLERVEPNFRSKRMLVIKRYKHSELGGGKKRKGQVIHF
ncbi:60S ribosomal protein L36a-like [Dromiciops gliroides]|uniref:60S ribosomal protein L36a-like n=1 Tax=Dromiciops gliroides TaxID=33562 RepID=UPI001CC78DC1|nr:60S ribosomal protein L36a-like [Dromiciops gliroides]